MVSVSRSAAMRRLGLVLLLGTLTFFVVAPRAARACPS
jgi:hypothetical protein